MWFMGVEIEQETSAQTPKKNPGSAPAFERRVLYSYLTFNHTLGSSASLYVKVQISFW